MPSGTPAPTAPTRLRMGAGDTYQAGDLTLTPGSALVGTRTAKSFQLDADATDGLQPSGLYLPTLAALADAAIFTQLRTSQAVRLRYMEVNLLAAAVAADAGNNAAVRVRDAFGASAVLPLSSTATRRFTFDGSTADKKVYQTSGGGAGVGQCCGMWTPITMTADVFVTAAQFATYNTPGAAGAGINKVYEILDSTGAVIATTDPFTTAINTVDNVLGTVGLFRAGVTLKQGVTYHVGFRTLDGGNNSLTPSGIAGPPTLANATLTAAQSHMTTTPGQTFAQSTTGFGIFGPNYGLSFALLGSTLGVRLAGDVHVDVVQNGTGGTPGTGANVRFAWNQST